MMRVIAIVYLFLATAYAAHLPAGKGPDETAHVRYLQFLAREHRLPVFNAQNPDPDYEFHQPPLYYLVTLPAYLLAGADADAQQAVRFVTLLITLPLIYLTFLLGRRLAPDHPWAATAAAGLVAFLPAQLSVATTIGNDGLTEVLAAGALLVLTAYLQAAASHRNGERESAPGLAAPIAAGFLIGLALLTKSIAILLFPVAWLAVALAARGPDGCRWRTLARDLLAVTGLALLVSGWWLVRNQILYGDPLAQRAFLDAFQGLRPSPQSFMKEFHVTSTASYVGQVMIWTMASITGVFGPVSGNRFVFLPYYIYFATGLLAIAAAFGFARCWERSKQTTFQRQSWALWGLLLLLLLASFVRFNFSFFQAQARYLFPALPAAALAFSLGLQTLFPPRSRPYILMTVTFLLAALAFVALPVWILPRFVGA